MIIFEYNGSIWLAGVIAKQIERVYSPVHPILICSTEVTNESVTLLILATSDITNEMK